MKYFRALLVVHNRNNIWQSCFLSNLFSSSLSCSFLIKSHCAKETSIEKTIDF